MSDQLLGVDTSELIASTGRPRFALGTRHTDKSGYEWMYVQSSVAFAQYDVVTIKSTFQGLPITAASAKVSPMVGFAQVAFAVDEFGWVMTQGKPVIRVLVDAAVDKPLYTSGTAGALDDATTSQAIRGLVLEDTMTTTTSGTVTALATFPQVEWGATLSQI